MSRRTLVVAGVAAVLVAMAPLLVFWGGFYTDWFNGLWMAGYDGEFLRQHGSFPVVLNSRPYTGVPFPLFYGYLLFPAIGVLSSVLGPSAAVRLLAVAFWLLQFFLVERVVWAASRRRVLSFAIACIMAWTPYPLTNLYNRSALPEFFATTFVLCAVCGWCLLLLRSDRRIQAAHAVSAGLLLASAAASHPLTTAVSAVGCGALVLCSLPALRRFERAHRLTLLAALGGCALAAVGLVSPWLWAMRTYGGQIEVRNLFGMWFYSEIDHWLTRIFPVPFDRRGLIQGVDPVSTPYLDSQMCMPLLLIAGWAAVEVWRRKAWRSPFFALAVGSGVLFLFAMTLSLSPPVYEYLPKAVGAVQFLYRYVTYVNLFLFTTVVGLLACRFNEGKASPEEDPIDLAGHRVVTAAWTVGLVGLLIKLTHVWAIAGMGSPGGFAYRDDELEGVRRIIERHSAPIQRGIPPPRGYGISREDRDALVDMPKSFLAAGDYDILAGYQQVDGSLPAGAVNLPVGTGPDFGIPQPLTLNVPGESWLVTSLMAFPWNGLELDGSPVARSDLRLYKNRLSIRVGPGNHTLQATLSPDPTWLQLRRLSLSVFALWLLVAAGMWTWIARRRSAGAKSE